MGDDDINLPLVGVGKRQHTGMYTLVDEPDDGPLEVMPITEALERAWPWDAHFFCYEPDPLPEPVAWYRINKLGPVLGEIRAAGFDLVSKMAVYDFDFPGHADSTPELRAEFLQIFARAQEQYPLAARWYAWYFTRAGARIIYLYDGQAPVDTGEGYLRGFRQKLAEAGLWLDERCRDWTRCFRLPYVVRDGVASWDEDYTDGGVRYQRPMRLPLAETPWEDPGAASTYGQIDDGDYDQPDVDVVNQLTEIAVHNGREAPTPWAKEAKRRLKGRGCFGPIFNHAQIAKAPDDRGPEEIGRDDAIQMFVGEAVRLLHHVEGSSRELVYALFLPSVQQLEPDSQTRDWLKVLWRAVCKYWSCEDAKNAVANAAQVQQEHNDATVLVSIRNSRYEWQK